MDERFLDGLKSHKVLSELSEIYYHNTGMIISFHYPGEDGRYDFYPQEQRSSFCKIIQTTSAGARKCMECDRLGLATARSRNSYYIYTCHAGLVDFVIPLIYQGDEVGSIYSGQILTKRGSPQEMRALYKRLDYLDITLESFGKAYKKVKVVDKQQVEFYARLLSLIGNYIVKTESELRLQDEVMQKDRELHRQEQEKTKLEKSLRDLTISILESEKLSTPKQLDLVNPNNGYIISKAQLFIKTNYGRDIRLNDVARAVYLSPNYFSSLFNKMAGCTFSSYLVKKRIEASRPLLSVTETPIKEIVARVGFNDYNYFNKTFKRLMEITPGQYRKQQRTG